MVDPVSPLIFVAASTAWTLAIAGLFYRIGYNDGKFQGWWLNANGKNLDGKYKWSNDP